MSKAIDILAKYQKYLLGLGIFLSMAAVSFSIQDGQINLGLQNYPVLMFLMVGLSLLLIILYIEIDKSRINKLSKEITTQSHDKPKNIEKLLSELTSRQKEVYDLIVSGKSNKEIMEALFIEQSTLKSHINQIYKKLDIKSRKELKARSTR